MLDSTNAPDNVGGAAEDLGAPSQILPRIEHNDPFERTELLGVRVVRESADLVLSLILGRLATGAEPTTVFFANAHSLNLTRRIAVFRHAMHRATLVLNDGAGLAIAGRVRRRPFPVNLNGSDFTPRVLGLAAAAEAPVYFLGGAPGVAERAAERLTSEIDGLVVAGCHHGYFSTEQTQQVIAEIRESSVELILVAMGNPRQELWLTKHLHATGAHVGIGVGAFFDFTSQTVSRAPAWMNKLGIEWLWRLVLEPRRLAKRYLMGNPLFVLRVVAEALRLRRR